MSVQAKISFLLIGVLALIAVACVEASVLSDNSYEEFETNFVQVFEDSQKLADELVQGGSTELGYALKRISNLYVLIGNLQYVLEKVSINLVEQRKAWLLKNNIGFSQDFILARVLLRTRLDERTFSTLSWKIVYYLTERYVLDKADSRVLTLLKTMLSARKKLEASIERVGDLHEALVSLITPKDLSRVTKRLDDRIELLSSCSSCHFLDEDPVYGVRPLYGDGDAATNLLGKMSNRELLEKISQSNDVVSRNLANPDESMIENMSIENMDRIDKAIGVQINN